MTSIQRQVALSLHATDTSHQDRRITQSYSGSPVLRRVNLDAAPGTILASLGSNGAGKTTLVRILSILLKTESGTATVPASNVMTYTRARAVSTRLADLECGRNQGQSRGAAQASDIRTRR